MIEKFPQSLPQSDPEKEKKENSGTTRREVLTGVLAVATTSLLGGDTITEQASFDGGQESQDTIRERVQIEGEMFKKEQALYSNLYTLSYNKIIFYDEQKNSIGKPVEVRDAEVVDTATGQKRIVSPGERNKDGIIKELSQEWIDIERVRVCTEHHIVCDLEKGTPKQTNTIAMVRKAKESDRSVQAETLLDLVHHYGNQTVKGDSRTRIEYAREEFGNQGLLPEHIADELAAIVPGLGAQESQYNNAALSPTGAKGIFQFQPATWKGLGYEEDDILNFKTQVQAVEKHFANSYKFFKEQDKKHPRLSIVKETFFDNNQEDYEKYFLVPLIINAYNAGDTRVFSVVGNFLTHFPTKEKLQKELAFDGADFGYDIFAFMARYTAQHGEVGGYGRDSSEYFSRVVAMTNLLQPKNLS